jgi:hypothetical protein
MKDLWLMTVDELEDALKRQKSISNNGYASLWINQLEAELAKRRVSEMASAK